MHACVLSKHTQSNFTYITYQLVKSSVMNNNFDTPVKEERSVLFNDKLNTFYLQLHGIGLVVMDH